MNQNNLGVHSKDTNSTGGSFRSNDSNLEQDIIAMYCLCCYFHAGCNVDTTHQLQGKEWQSYIKKKEIPTFPKGSHYGERKNALCDAEQMDN